MPFELQQVTEVAFTNSNPRSEFHGEDHVRAIDISMTITGENTLLDRVEPGLREHHYCNRDMKAGQQPLPDVVIPLPHLKHPKLPTRIAYGAKSEKPHGYRFIIDYGLGDEGGSNVDLTDCALGSVWYEMQEGGTCTVGFTVQYNGDELGDDRLYGRLAGLTSLGKGHVQLLAPATLLPVAKGWRSGKADTPPMTDGGGALFEKTGDDTEDDVVHPEGSPEAALASAVAADAAEGTTGTDGPPRQEGAWPFPRDGRKPAGRGRRGAGAAA